MSIKGFSIGGVTQKYDYNALDNIPNGEGLSEEAKQALLQLAQKVAYIDDQGQTYYQDLYDALYPPKTVVLITAVFNQGSAVIYDDTALNDLKEYLTVTAKYDDNTTAILADGAYTLSGLLEAPSSTVTVLYSGVSTTFSVAVTARPALSSISAVYTQSGTVYDTDSLDSLKPDLIVTAVYSDSSTATVAAEDYTLSGELTEGISSITVSYGGKTTTFDVTVSIIPNDYQHVEYIGATGTQYIQTDVTTTAAERRKYGFVIDCKADQWHSAYNINMAAALDTGGGLWLGYINSVQAMGLGADSGCYFTTGSPNDRHSYSLSINQETQLATCTRDDGAAVTRSSTGSVSNNDRTFCLFYYKLSSSSAQQPWYFYGKIYGCTLTKDGAVYRRYVPCYRKADGVIGMYETVVGEFFTNSGTGTFTKGDDVA